MKKEDIDKLYNDLCEKAREVGGVDVRYTRKRDQEVIIAKGSINRIMCVDFGLGPSRTARLSGVDHTVIIHDRDEHMNRYRWLTGYANMYNELMKFVNLQTDPTTEEIIELLQIVRKPTVHLSVLEIV